MKLLQEQANVYGKGDIMSLSEPRKTSRAAPVSTATDYIRSFYEEWEKEAMGSRDIDNVYIENNDRNARSFVFLYRYFPKRRNGDQNIQRR